MEPGAEVLDFGGGESNIMAIVHAPQMKILGLSLYETEW